MSSFLRNRIQYALLHETYYIETELTKKLNEVMNDKTRLRVECDIDGFNVRVLDLGGMSSDEITKKIKQIVGCFPFQKNNVPTFMYHNIIYRFNWCDIINLK